MTSPIELVIPPRSRAVGSGEVQRLLPFRARRMVGPFVFADLIGPDRLAPGQRISIDAHPHIGLATVTYLFDGRMIHRDSTGAVQSIVPGDVNWMTAGGGVSHTERSHPDDEREARVVHGLQTWVALPFGLENGPASFQHLDGNDVPETVIDGARVRMAAGSAFGLESPIAVASPLVLAEIDLGNAAEIELPADHPERAVLAIDGPVALDDVPLDGQHLAVIAPGAIPMLSGSGRVVVLGGDPVGQRHIRWNFVHSDLAVIDRAAVAWSAQDFPKVPDDHDPWIPMPH